MRIVSVCYTVGMATKPSSKTYITARQAADLLGYRSLRTIKRKVEDGTLYGKRYSPSGERPRLYIARSSVEAVLRGRSA